MTYDEADQRIKELVDEEFLIKLTEIGRCYGWSGDYVEIGQFIEELWRDFGKEPPDVSPYELTQL